MKEFFPLDDYSRGNEDIVLDVKDALERGLGVSFREDHEGNEWAFTSDALSVVLLFTRQGIVIKDIRKHVGAADLGANAVRILAEIATDAGCGLFAQNVLEKPALKFWYHRLNFRPIPNSADYQYSV